MAIILGTPASNLESSNFASRDTLQTGALGEKKTAKVLDRWGLKFPNAIIAHSVSLPGVGNGDTDHIVAIGNNVLIIDSKRWKGGYTYSFTKKFEVRKTEGMKNPSGRGFKAGRIHTQAQIEKWGKELGPEFSVAGLVVIAADVRVIFDENWQKAPFKLVPLGILAETLDGLFVKKNDPPNEKFIKIVAERLIR